MNVRSMSVICATLVAAILAIVAPKAATANPGSPHTAAPAMHR
ncbi:MAG: hypothetical protein JWL76_1735 [Thermoleophilia bacterium]|nr:hypothetical protein [Thermoleophilia bacterium]